MFYKKRTILFKLRFAHESNALHEISHEYFISRPPHVSVIESMETGVVSSYRRLVGQLVEKSN